MSWPGLALHQMHNPTAHVVEGDLRGLGVDLVARYGAELDQWRRREKKKKREPLTPTAWAVVAVLAFWRGLRSGVDGCGVQASVRAWARLLGRSERMVSFAFAELAAAGLVWRRPRQLAHRWHDGKRWLEHADIHSVAYLTVKGVARLEGVSPQRRIRRLVVKDGASTRVLQAFGLVGTLLKTLEQKIRLVARRVSALKNRFRPTAVKLSRRNNKTGRSAPRGRAQGPTSTGQLPSLQEVRRSEKAAGKGGDRARLFELFRRGQLTPASAWPDLWRPLKQLWIDKSGAPHFEPRTKRHWWLIRECEQLAREFSALELQRRLTARA